MSENKNKKAFGLPSKTKWIDILTNFIENEYNGLPTVIEILDMCALIEEYSPLIDRYGLPDGDLDGLLHCIIQKVNPTMIAPEDI